MDIVFNYSALIYKLFWFDTNWNLLLLMIHFWLESEFGCGSENCPTDDVENRQAQMTDEEDGAPELDRRGDPEEPEPHSEIWKPLEPDEPPDPVVGLSQLAVSVLNELPPKDFVEQVLHRQHECARAEREVVTGVDPVPGGAGCHHGESANWNK